ncbi:MAG: hypothetical protein HN712_04810 [Gemmatimonadetes bacterium]|jgi:hypothetical protein|nr:hypothetical protein [Gemmatimonadota bacterium]MBT6144228.1 hypothetical protein [Gemmatimonadota bacterium]MBT7859607.1 hypothetical protein [Gemmatimonadota bacterium]
MAILSRLLLIVLLLLLSACASTGHKLHPVPGLPPAVDVTIQPAYIPPGASASRMSYSTPFERGLVESQVVERLVTRLPEADNIADAGILGDDEPSDFTLAIRLWKADLVADRVSPGEVDYVVVHLGIELQHGPSSQTLIYRRAELHHSLRHGGTDGLYDFLADEVARSTSEQIARLQSISTSR